MSCELYELEKLWETIEDRPDNSTRFLIIGREDVGPSGDDKTSIVVSVNNRPGALHDLLEPFRKHDLDMTRLESRPSRSSKWSYVFFIDFSGHQDDPVAAKVLEELADEVAELKVLGSYPRAITRAALATTQSEITMMENASTADRQINRLVVIGLGLIGFSLAVAARKSRAGQRSGGYLKASFTLDLALEMGVVDRAEESLAAIAPQLGAGDLVVIGVPTLTVPAILEDCHRLLSPEVTITDVASVKWQCSRGGRGDLR